jgi:hypothetical protein
MIQRGNVALFVSFKQNVPTFVHFLVTQWCSSLTLFYSSENFITSKSRITFSCSSWFILKFNGITVLICSYGKSVITTLLSLAFHCWNTEVVIIKGTVGFNDLLLTTTINSPIPFLTTIAFFDSNCVYVYNILTHAFPILYSGFAIFLTKLIVNYFNLIV